MTLPALPSPKELLDGWDARDESYDIGAPVEEVFDGSDGPVVFYARRRLEWHHELGEDDEVAGIGVAEADQKAIDGWISGYVEAWRGRYGNDRESR